MDFFAVYRRESGDFDWDYDYVKKCDEGLNTSLIFVSHLLLVSVLNVDSGAYLGRFVLYSQFSIHHRYPIKARTRSERHDHCLHADPHPQCNYINRTSA